MLKTLPTQTEYDIIKKELDHKKLARSLAEKGVDVYFIDFIVEKYKKAVEDLIPRIYCND